ncbi:MAG: thiol:disulfide interchange protein DsbA/DsbL [Gammaproteobacteria bacterium]|nr:thiol:disulfide interchange protein DsbA/DsbL [Candidatus Brocadiales bacterium]MBL7005201.1 thiol:disulfide interchange protein DsbA/DsbL [Gammaproteobacteria bacterium]
MLKKIAQTSLIIFLFSFSTLLKAEPVGYAEVIPVQPTHNPDKIEIIEFFWYGCPHCYSFEPLLEKWVKSLPKNVEFIRQPAVFSDLWGKHAKAYFTAEALGVVDKVHADFFDAIQNKKQHLETEDQLAKFFVAHGVNENQFHDTYNSFLIDAKMRQATTMAGRYGVTGVPAIIINGKFKTNGPIAGSHEKMLEVIDQLIKQESAKK